jgi:hypothetical protein
LLPDIEYADAMQPNYSLQSKILVAASMEYLGLGEYFSDTVQKIIRFND